MTEIVLLVFALCLLTGCEATRPALVVNLNKNGYYHKKTSIKKNTKINAHKKNGDKGKKNWEKNDKNKKELDKKNKDRKLNNQNNIQKSQKIQLKKAPKKIVTISKVETKEALPVHKVKWTWPAKGKILKYFKESKHAKGIDISGNASSPVKAAGAGSVVYSGSSLKGYGNLIIIKHENDFLSAYAHNDKLMVKEGEQVKLGQEIAKMGKTDAERVKLHFEIRYKGKPVDPMRCLPKI